MLRRLPGLMLVVLATSATALAQPAAEGEQLDRRDRREPAIVLNTGGRTGTCDSLRFTPDGKFLLGAGDDKAVTIYPVGDKGLDERGVRFLRWPTWREQRGSIFAMDISTDGQHVAIGGYGLINSSVAVIDRATGKIERMANLEQGQENFYAVMALAFAPKGEFLAAGTGNGAIWVWDFNNAPVVIERHQPLNNTVFNRVRAIRVEDANTIYSIAENGRVARWTRGPQSWGGAVAVDLEVKNSIRTATFSPSGWVAAGELGPVVHVASPDGKVPHVIELANNEFPRSLALSADGTRLAVGVGRNYQGRSFQLEGEDEIRLFDIAASGVTKAGVFPHTGRAEALAWQGDRLAVAGGDNHEIRLWDVKTREKIGAAQGTGRGLWGIALTSDSRYLAFNQHRAANAPDPNRRAVGEARYFDLRRRRLEKGKPEGSKLVEKLESYDGWTVRPDPALPWQWHLVNGGQAFRLPWDRDMDGRPTCYTFVKPADGHPWRLAVGHYWGFSLFEMRDGAPVRIRLYTGHHGEVAAIAPSDNGTWLVTASPDQTVAAWSLADWPTKTAMGASFSLTPGSVRVDKVDAGSPAWEMGLVAEDEIVGVAIDTKDFFVAGRLRTPADAKAVLDNPTPGKELFLFVKRAGKANLVRTLSFVRTRPLWRFLPSPDREWVLWMWQGSYYDTATNGDSLAGFLINDPAKDPTRMKEPRYFKLEQFRDVFQREDVIDELIDHRDIGKALEVALGTNPVAVDLGLNEPPGVRIELTGETAEKPVSARLVATARGDNIDFQPQRVEFWINDFRAQTWERRGQPFDETITIDLMMLRSGPNKLTLQVFNRLGGRSETTRALLNPHKADSRTLLGLGVGIDDYSSTPSVGGKRAFGNLKGPVSDVTLQSQTWSSQKGKLFDDAAFALKPNKSATREQVIAELDRLAATAKPDDLLVIVLAGHGDFRTTPSPKPKKPATAFYFCCPEYDPKRPAETGIEHTTLYDKLARIKCRKLVILDACHSGEAAFNPVRSLTPGGQGPTILAACDRSELAYEHPEKHNGLFTLAILKALGDGFADADTNHDGQLDARELIDAVRKQMPALLRDAKMTDDLQNPQCFPRQPEAFPLFRK